MTMMIHCAFSFNKLISLSTKRGTGKTALSSLPYPWHVPAVSMSYLGIKQIRVGCMENQNNFPLYLRILSLHECTFSTIPLADQMRFSWEHMWHDQNYLVFHFLNTEAKNLVHHSTDSWDHPRNFIFLNSNQTYKNREINEKIGS